MSLSNDLIYDWNRVDGPEIKLDMRPVLNDETLRDGLQSPSVLDPPIEKKIQILRLMEDLGIDSLNLGLPAMYVTEDTTRARPEVLKKLYTTAIECGARAIVVCDTVGHVTPAGVRALLGFVREEVVAPSGENVRLDWHGHSDRGLAVANSLAAFAAGADSVHAAALGIGERVGNTAMDQMLVNLKLMGAPGWADRDLRKLKEYCSTVSEAVGAPIPPNYPVVGSDAFRTATGVHAAAVIKAFRKHDAELANQVYSGVPSHWFGMEQKIEIGPMSGKSNVIFWLERRGIEPGDDLVEKIFARAKQADRLLTEAEIMEAAMAPFSRKS